MKGEEKEEEEAKVSAAAAAVLSLVVVAEYINVAWSAHPYRVAHCKPSSDLSAFLHVRLSVSSRSPRPPRPP